MLLTWEEISHIFLLSGFLLFIPGPTNTLLLIAGATLGFLRAQKLILVEVAGYVIAISCWGFMMAALSSHFHGIVVAVKITSAIYIFWLSIKIWRSQQQNTQSQAVGAKNLFIATLFNPKAFVLATYILPNATFTYAACYVAAMLGFLAALLPISVLFCLSGNFIHYKGKKESGIIVPIFIVFSPLLLVGFRSLFYMAFYFTLEVI